MKNKIVLFASNLKYVGVPLALLSITKLLDTKKYDIHIITRTEYPNYENEILKHCENALCFGVSCITGTPIKAATRTSELVKRKYPSLPIIWGGWQAITLPDETLKTPYVDYLCSGQGERTFSEFISMIENNNFDNIDNIRGLSYKKDGIIIHNQRSEPDDLNQFPDFDLNLINWGKYLEVTDFGAKVLRIATSYGCPYRCGFCCEPYSSKRRWKPLSAGRVIGFLKELRAKVAFDGLTIVDNNFFVHEQRVIDFCEGLIENDFQIKFGQVNGRPDTLVKFKESTWGLLKQAGLYNILIGAESGSNETLKLINKDAKVEDTYLLGKICKQYGIKLVVSTIIGLPTNAYLGKDAQKAFDDEFKVLTDLYNSLFGIDKNHHLLTFPYTPLPFSPLYEKAIELGFVPPKDLAEWSDYELSDIHINWLSKKNINKINMLNFTSMIISIDFKYLIKSLPFFIRCISIPVILLAKFVCSLRLKYKFFSFPIDNYFFAFGINQFKRINRILRIVNVGE